MLKVETVVVTVIKAGMCIGSACGAFPEADGVLCILSNVPGRTMEVDLLQIETSGVADVVRKVLIAWLARNHRAR